MSLIDLINSDKSAAQKAVAEAMQSKVFDYLDNYVLEDTIDEAVVPGSVKKDSKGNVLSFKTEDFEAMTQEEFDSIDEEQLDEVSKDTLRSYVSKAAADKAKQKLTIDKEAQKIYLTGASDKSMKTQDTAYSKIAKRDSGISTAANKLAK